MPNKLAPGTLFKNRTPGVVPINITIDREAYERLQQLAPTSKAYGHYLSRLVHEQWTRQEERTKLRERLEGVLSEG